MSETATVESVELGRHGADAVTAARAYADALREIVHGRVAENGRISTERANQFQRVLHGLAWVTTSVAAMEQTYAWWQSAGGADDGPEGLVTRIVLGEYLAQLQGGVVMSQNEIVRPHELGASDAATVLGDHPAVRWFADHGNTTETRSELVALMRRGQMPHEVLGDDTLDMVRSEIRRFTDSRIKPEAHAWHLADELIPDEVVAEMAALGVFGVCISPDFGGHGLGKLAMCVVSEELSRGWIGAGSLGTRSEIAGELITIAGTQAQKER